MPLSLLKSPTIRAGFFHALGPLIVAFTAWLLVVTHLDPGGSDPNSGEGPGLTIDESFNVQNGILLVESWRNYGIAMIFPEAARDVFHPREGIYLNDHPPLGRLWLGVHHHLAWWWKPPQGIVEPYHPIKSCVTARARTGSASAFALTILLLGVTASCWYGHTVGVLTALAYATIPRVFGHSHIASLETFTNLTYTLAVIAVASAWRSDSTPKWKTAGWTGAVYGLVLLSKMQAVFIPIPLAGWAFYRWRHRAIAPLAIWGLAAFIVFIIGWPTHWFEPWVSIPKYFRGAADRAALSVCFNGAHFTDKTVPRTYVLMTFLWTVPVAIPLLAAIGAVVRWRTSFREGEAPAEPRALQNVLPRSGSAGASPSRNSATEWFILLEAIFPLVMFSLPRTPVYDAERLWLPAVPLLVLSAAAGIDRLLSVMAGKNILRKRAAIAFIGLVIVSPAMTMFQVAPCYLSSFNTIAGRLPRAEHTGQELDYWANAVTRSLLADVVKHVPRGSTVAVSPTLHQFQVEDLWLQSPILRGHDVKLVAYDPKSTTMEYVLVFRRRADLAPQLEQQLRDGPRMAEVARDGVVLAGLLRVTPRD